MEYSETLVNDWGNIFWYINLKELKIYESYFLMPSITWLWFCRLFAHNCWLIYLYNQNRLQIYKPSRKNVPAKITRPIASQRCYLLLLRTFLFLLDDSRPSSPNLDVSESAHFVVLTTIFSEASRTAVTLPRWNLSSIAPCILNQFFIFRNKRQYTMLMRCSR